MFSQKAALGCGLVFWFSLTSVDAGESRPAWEEWEEAVEAAYQVIDEALKG